LLKLQKLYGGKRVFADRVMTYPVYRSWEPWRAVLPFISQFRPDLAVIQAGWPLNLADRFVELKIPAIVYFHDASFQELGAPVMPDPLLRFAACSEFIAALAKTKLGVDSTVIPPIVPSERFQTKTTRDKLVFINPIATKGVEIALQLAERRRDIPFLFVEAWPLTDDERAGMQARVSNLSNVSWMPIQSDMRAVYRHARAMLVPSQCDEAWGRVVSEAQLNGIPALASRAGGLPESVGPGGILVDREAPIGDWERALGQLWDDPQTYQRLCGLALLHSQRETLQPPAIAERFLAVIYEHAKSRMAV
jgi:glycosyltransferase involved in cell wall biosynthesis